MKRKHDIKTLSYSIAIKDHGCTYKEYQYSQSDTEKKGTGLNTVDLYDRKQSRLPGDLSDERDEGM